MKEGQNNIIAHAKDFILRVVSSKSKTFLAFCFCFIVGVGVASLFNQLPSFYLYISLFFILFLTIIFWKNKLYRFLLCSIFFLLFGAWRFAITVPSCTDRTNLCFYNDKKVVLNGSVSAEPDIRIDSGRYTVSVQKADEHSVDGKALVKTLLYPEYHYSDELKVTCSLQKPESADDSTFRYDKYLARFGIWSICNNPKIEKIGDNQGNKITYSILWFKTKVADLMSRLWAEPENSFMAGILYGSKSGLPEELMANFSRTGVTHIIAVSGFNITIIAGALMTVLIYAGFYRRQAFWVVIAIIILFVVFTGSSASAVRAGVMGTVALLAQYLGRSSRMTNVLIFSAAVMLVGNPYLLVWDAGFQLSFLATIGLVYISPVLEKTIPALPEKGILNKLEIIKEPFTTTLAAIIATLPLILYQFGKLSLVAPLVNVLVLWIIPLLMLFGFLALVFGVIFFPIGQLIAWLAGTGLRYVILVVNFFGSKNWAALDVAIPWWVMLLMYGGIFILFYGKKQSNTALVGARL